MIAHKKPDRRIERTRGMLLDAFRDLILEHGYAQIRVGDIINRANVGRSTFYEHFESKTDILRQSVGPLCEVLAQSVDQATQPPQLARIVDHFHENAKLARLVFSGASGRILVAALAERIETHVAKRVQNTNGAKPVVPVRFIAQYIAQAQLALLDAWLVDPETCAARAIAQALSAAAYVSSSALTGVFERTNLER